MSKKGPQAFGVQSVQSPCPFAENKQCRYSPPPFSDRLGSECVYRHARALFSRADGRTVVPADVLTCQCLRALSRGIAVQQQQQQQRIVTGIPACASIKTFKLVYRAFLLRSQSEREEEEDEGEGEGDGGCLGELHHRHASALCAPWAPSRPLRTPLCRRPFVPRVYGVIKF